MAETAQATADPTAEAWDAWEAAIAKYGQLHRVYGAALHSKGETFYQLSPRRQVEVVMNGGYCAISASPSQLGLLDAAMAKGQFMICVQKRGGGMSAGNPILRVWPGKVEGWSVKSLHPDLGGKGMGVIYLRG